MTTVLQKPMIPSKHQKTVSQAVGKKIFGVNSGVGGSENNKETGRNNGSKTLKGKKHMGKS